MKRSNSLDALRGFAILAMVLSSSIAFGILPDWMYHAQTPPPSHKFNPELPGITWVDLVFPFFLFSMGAAIPLALHAKKKVLGVLGQRFILLIFFAVFTLHTRDQQFISIGAFVLLCFLFIRMESQVPKYIALTAAVTFLVYKGVDVYKSDIIILVLANMAFFGGITWWLTAKQPLLRLGVLPFIAAVFLAAETPGSWAEAIYNWSPLPWMYKFYYLKYLFIILPGTFAGEWLLLSVPEIPAWDKRKWMMIAGGAFLLVIVNVVCLFSRQVVLNLALSVLIGTFMLVMATKVQAWKNYLQAGVYLLWLGLCFDCTQGGIKKDPSNYSYYFVTGGLAFLTVLGFMVLEYYGYCKRIISYLAINGRNPMVAYVAGNLLLLPLLKLTGAIDLFSAMEHNVWLGVLRGLLFTGIVSLITVFFVQRKWYWKT
jgi:predicted acyltransferase